MIKAFFEKKLNTLIQFEEIHTMSQGFFNVRVKSKYRLN
ncbi:uncharacterized protein METZ01_LOCUS450276 [marine metagenome]|uniref:Uncharacterized protein n=1 Tax=marine metagenome TaxID=408172 RepID=A0A382ZPN1_9ZZZZ